MFTVIRLALLFCVFAGVMSLSREGNAAESLKLPEQEGGFDNPIPPVPDVLKASRVVPKKAKSKLPKAEQSNVEQPKGEQSNAEQPQPEHARPVEPKVGQSEA